MIQRFGYVNLNKGRGVGAKSCSSEQDIHRRAACTVQAGSFESDLRCDFGILPGVDWEGREIRFFQGGQGFGGDDVTELIADLGQSHSD